MECNNAPFPPSRAPHPAVPTARTRKPLPHPPCPVYNACISLRAATSCSRLISGATSTSTRLATPCATPRSIIMMRRAFPHGPRPPSPAACRTISRRTACYAPARSILPHTARAPRCVRPWRRTRPGSRPHYKFSPHRTGWPRHAGRWCWPKCLEVHAAGNGAIHDQVRARRVG